MQGKAAAAWLQLPLQDRKPPWHTSEVESGPGVLGERGVDMNRERRAVGVEDGNTPAVGREPGRWQAPRRFSGPDCRARSILIPLGFAFVASMLILAMPCRTTVGRVAAADATAKIVISPQDATVAAGIPFPYSIEGFDSNGNDLGDLTNVTETQIVGPDRNPIPCNWPSPTCTAKLAGDSTIMATYGEVRAQTTLHVVPGPLAHLKLTPALSVVALGAPVTPVTYSATGQDAYGNATGDVTSATTFTVNAGGSCSGDVCTVPGPGGYVVTGTDGGATGTASIVVEGDSGLAPGPTPAPTKPPVKQTPAEPTPASKPTPQSSAVMSASPTPEESDAIAGPTEGSSPAATATNAAEPSTPRGPSTGNNSLMLMAAGASVCAAVVVFGLWFFGPMLSRKP
jgi:hypothetical protein